MKMRYASKTLTLTRPEMTPFAGGVKQILGVELAKDKRQRQQMQRMIQNIQRRMITSVIWHTESCVIEMDKTHVRLTTLGLVKQSKKLTLGELEKIIVR